MTKREIILHYPWNAYTREIVADDLQVLGEQYGGYTTHEVQGGWHNDQDGTWFEEEMLRVIVAIEPVKEQEAVDAFKIDLRFLGEKAAYWVDTFGGVHIDALD